MCRQKRSYSDSAGAGGNRIVTVTVVAAPAVQALGLPEIVAVPLVTVAEVPVAHVTVNV